MRVVNRLINQYSSYNRLLVFIVTLCILTTGCSKEKDAQSTTDTNLISQEVAVTQEEDVLDVPEETFTVPPVEEKPPLPEGWPKPPHDFYIDGITMTTDKEEYPADYDSITITITNEKYDIVGWGVLQSYLLRKVQDNYGPWEGVSKWEDAAYYAGLKISSEGIGSRSQGYDIYEHTNEYIVSTGILFGESRSITFYKDDFIHLIDPLPAGDYIFQTIIKGGYFSDTEEGLYNYEDERNVGSLRYCVDFKITE